jgi:hypothetical protein
MLTKEEIICGTKEELLEYFSKTYNLIELDNIEQANKNLPTVCYSNLPIGNIEKQLKKIHEGFGGIFFIKNVVEFIDKNPVISTEIVKIWVFIRNP